MAALRAAAPLAAGGAAFIAGGGVGLAALASAAVWVVCGPSLRQCGVGALNAYRALQLFILRLRGRTPAGEAERKVVSGEAWAEFCDTLKAAGAVVMMRGAPTDPFNQAEGYRYLSRLARVALEYFVECADPAAPKLVALANGCRDAPVKLGSDSPDNLYQNAALSNEYVYRLSGNCGTVHHLAFGLQAGVYGRPGGLRTVDYKERKELQVGSDGAIEIIVSTEARRPPGAANWLCMAAEPPQHMVIVRQTFLRRSEEQAAELRVERLDAPTLPRPLTPAALAEGLETAGLFVAGAPMMFANWAAGFQKHANKLPLFDQEKSNKVGGDPKIRYYHSFWRLGKGEALVVTAAPPECDSWNFQVNNYWMESLDYRYHRIHVNKGTATYRSDGSVCVVVAHEDPGVSDVDWLTTDGHFEGTMCWRWIHPARDPCPEPHTEVVNLSAWAAERR